MWKKPEGCPQSLSLYLLSVGDQRAVARTVSCDQDIAADGVFSAGMLVAFDEALSAAGPGMYSRLFWETGVIGQVLYLEAEAARIQATGIGCFHDDEVHRILGINDHSWQSLYHFTMGGSCRGSSSAVFRCLPAFARRADAPFNSLLTRLPIEVSRCRSPADLRGFRQVDETRRVGRAWGELMLYYTLGSDPALWPARERREREFIMHDKGYYHILSRSSCPTTRH